MSSLSPGHREMQDFKDSRYLVLAQISLVGVLIKRLLPDTAMDALHFSWPIENFESIFASLPADKTNTSPTRLIQ